MKKTLLRFCSAVLTLVMLCNMLPVSAFAEEVRTDAAESTSEVSVEEVHVVGEVTRNRTEFSKEFMLSNGVHLASE